MAVFVVVVPALWASIASAEQSPEQSEPSAGPSVEPSAEIVPAPASERPEVSSAVDLDGDRTRIAVILVGVGGASSELADSLAEVVIGVVASTVENAELVGREEVQVGLGQIEDRSVECISSNACIGRLGVELRVDEAIAGTVNQRGDGWVFNLNRIHIRSGATVGRIYEEVDGDLGDVAAALSRAVPSLYAPQRATLRLTVSSSSGSIPSVLFLDGVEIGAVDGSRTVTDLPLGRHDVVVRADGFTTFSREVDLQEDQELFVSLSPVSVVDDTSRATEARADGGRTVHPMLYVGGGALVIGATVSAVFGARSSRAIGDVNTRAEALAEQSDRERDARIANIGLAAVGVSAGMVLVGALLTRRANRGRQTEIAVSPTGVLLTVRR